MKVPLGLTLRLFLSLLSFVMGAKLVHALFSGKNGPHFTAKTFKAEVMDTEQTTLVLYYAPWCGYCKQFAPEYEKAARKLKGFAKVGAVNCDQEQALCAQAGIQGFPVVKAYYTNAKNRKRIPVEYQGERTAQSVVNFALDRLPNFVKPIRTVEQLGKFYNLENATLPKLVVVSPPSKGKRSPSNLLKALAVDYHYRVVVGEVQGATADDPVYSDFGVAPSGKQDKHVLLIRPSGDDGEKENSLVKAYDGELKQKALRTFLDNWAPKTKVVPASRTEKGSTKTQSRKGKAKRKQKERITETAQPTGRDEL